MSDKNEIKSLIESASFTLLNIETIKLPCIAESADELAFAFIDGSTIGNYIREKDESAIPDLRNKTAETIKQNFGDHPVKSTMQSLLIQALKLAD